MDLAADMLMKELGRLPADEVCPVRVCPAFRRRVSRLPYLGRRGAAANADRLWNRFWDYPRYLRRYAGAFDHFHVVDHSYAQLVHALPAHRTGVYCHDLDAFRCLLEPRREPRPRWFRALSRRILRGLQKAAVVFHSTREVGQRIQQYGLIDPARLVLAPYGPAPEFTTAPADGDAASEAPAAGVGAGPFLLHVGSCIPRKRIDVLLDVVAAVRARHPAIRLVQVGGSFTAPQRQQIERLHLGEAITQLRGLERRTIAALYRQAEIVLQPSEAEGFGLPVLEALSCGARVVASDLAVLREVGDAAVLYCPVGAIEAWTETVCRMLTDSATAPDRAARLAQAAKFSWAAQTRIILQAYQSLR